MSVFLRDGDRPSGRPACLLSNFTPACSSLSLLVLSFLVQVMKKDLGFRSWLGPFPSVCLKGVALFL